MSSLSDTTAIPDILPAVAESAKDVKQALQVKVNPPVPTASFSEEYIEACARSNEKASIKDPLTLLFTAEKFPPLPNEDTYQSDDGRAIPTSRSLWTRLSQQPFSEIEKKLYTGSVIRLRLRSPGSFIAEAGNFAAVACWEPKFAPSPPPDWSVNGEQTLVNGLIKDIDVTVSRPDITHERPLYIVFNEGIERAKYKHLYPVIWRHATRVSEDYLSNATCSLTRAVLSMNAKQAKPEDPRFLLWKLCMTSRNPAVDPPVPGAVRAVIEPFIKRWVDTDKMPIVWLEAGSPRARDVYGWLGFQVVGELAMGEDRDGNPVKTYFMVYTKHEI